MITTPRCREPVAYYDKGERAPDPFPVCWRPAGHPGGRHASRRAYLRSLRRHIAAQSRKRAAAREMSEAAGRVGA